MKSEGIFTPPKGNDKTGAEAGMGTKTVNRFFYKFLAPVVIIAIVATGIGTMGCVDGPDRTARVGRKVTAVRAGPSQTYEYSPKPAMRDDTQLFNDPLTSSETAIRIIPENICVEVSENRECIYGKGIGSGNEYWRFGVEGVEIPLPDKSKFPIINGHVYLATCGGLLIKICADDGTAVWRRNYDTQFKSQPQLASRPEGNAAITVTGVDCNYEISPDNGDLTALSSVAVK